MLSDLLKRRRWNVTTLDIDEDKNPDICASAVEFDYSSKKVDVILAFEVFEHMPYSTFKKVVDCLSGAKIKDVIFSLPWNEYRLVDFNLSMPIIRDIKIRIPIRKNKITTYAHFWELATHNKDLNGKRLVTLENIVDLFNENRYELTPLQKVKNIQYFKAGFGR